MKKKVGIFIGITPSMGGKFQYSQCLLGAAQALPQDEYDVLVAYSDPVWEPMLRDMGLPCFRVKFPRLTFALGTLLTVSSFPVSWWRKIACLVDQTARRLVREQCDLWVFSSYNFLCYQMPVQSVGIIHDLMHRYERQFSEVSALGVYAWREKSLGLVCKHAEAVLVDSRLGKEQVVESYDADPDRIYPLPFIAPKHVGVPRDLTEVVARYDLPSKFVFYPAQFWEHKNHKRLVSALARVKDVLPDIRLVLVGAKKNGYQSVRQLVADLGMESQIMFLGYVPDSDLAGMYRLARGLIMPTFFGPTNIPPLEAFVTGCPVAVSNVYAMPEQIGDAGILFDPRSVEDIATAVRRIWTDDELCCELVRRGRRRAAAWGQEDFNSRFEEILESVFRNA